MKKLLCLWIALIISFSFTACGRSGDHIEQPVSFYYRNAEITYNSEHAVIGAETRDSAGYDLTNMLNLYLSGPQSETLKSPFPSDVTIESLSQQGDRLQIVLSKPFGTLSGMDLTIACACLSKTVMDLTQCSSVDISLSDSPLGGNASVVMDQQNILYLDSAYLD